MEGAIAAVRDALMLDRDGRLEQLRELWPELAERVEAAAALLDSR